MSLCWPFVSGANRSKLFWSVKPNSSRFDGNIKGSIGGTNFLKSKGPISKFLFGLCLGSTLSRDDGKLELILFLGLLFYVVLSFIDLIGNGLKQSLYWKWDSYFWVSAIPKFLMTKSSLFSNE